MIRLLHRPRIPLSSVTACFATMAALFFAGCTTSPAPRGGRWVVSTPQAEFFRHGPAQAAMLPAEFRSASALPDNTGPDFQLPRGAVVTMLQREFGFSRVATDDGQTGYVANEQMKPAPALASAVPTEFRPSQTPRSRTKRIPAIPQREEQLDLSDIPLPLPI